MNADQHEIKRQLQVSREQATRLGRETVAIIEAGRYAVPSGRVVEIASMVEHAVTGTVSYPPGREPASRISQPVVGAPTVAILNETTLTAVRQMQTRGMNPAALNMASATSPGGGFLSGARAQEEYLARSSGLYACLRGNLMYACHREDRDPFYSDYVIYSPDVPVFRGDDGGLLDEAYPCSILTSPAVHANGVSRFMPQRVKDIGRVMEKRIQKLLAAAAAHGHTSLVLGAWGCGAFGNDGNLIAGLFRGALMGKFQDAFQNVVFAITDWSDDRMFIGPFEKAFASRKPA
jgi:uncharacterized protein (TIGR02452 family)